MIKEWLPERQRIEKIADKHGLRTVDVAANLDWNRSLYRDDGVHPNVQGIHVLASILSAEFIKDIQR
jgi:lysophospholipase L1-like esterase